MKREFGRIDGTPVDAVRLECGEMSAEILTYGATLRSLTVPDINGTPVDTVLGYDSVDDYASRSGRLGATIGRFANRIGGASFPLGGKVYNVTRNRGNHHIHGGNRGFDKRVWDIASLKDDSVTLRLTSPDGDEGYPGKLEAELTYVLTGKSLRLEYLAQSDSDTVCNLTNHSYFNLAGIEKVTSTVEGQMLTVNADRYLPIDKVSIPFGEKAPVEGTPFDFRTPHLVGERINDDNEQLRNGSGYDHSFAINQDKPGELCLATVFEDLKSGRVMKTYTTEPGIQVYTGNFLTGFQGKHGYVFPRRSGICFESQHHPDSPNKPQFEQATLAPGEVYHQLTIYAFSTK